MTLTTCPSCGTQTGAGVACLSCGTPVPDIVRVIPAGASALPAGGVAAATSSPAAEAPSGYASYWQGMLSRLQRLAAPKYRVTGILGYGGMAGVFGAEEPRLGRKVAIKVMSPALMMDPKLVERFVQEARTIALLNHPNIVTIYEVDEREDLHWFAMSYMPGRTLGQVMTDTLEPLAIDVVLAWLYQIGDALAYAHDHGVVHRDIKPGNVLLDLRGNAHVTDFGIAKVTDGDASLTRTGMLVGTPAYMSPEQCSSGEVNGASDQYSLGAVAYQMLTGQPPFAGPTLAVLQAHVAAPPRRIEELRPECPPDLADVVHRMLEKQPEDRWPSIGAAIAATGAAPVALDDPIRAELELLAAHTAVIEVTPQFNSLKEGARQPLTVSVRDAAGRTITNRRVDWKSSTPVVAAVAEATVSAYSPGSAQVEASCGPARAVLSITVEPDPIRDIEVMPKEITIPRGGTAGFDVAVYDLDGSRLEDRAVLWSTSDPTIARVSPEGAVQGVAMGPAIIAARTGGKYAAAAVTVTALEVAAQTAAGSGSQPRSMGARTADRSAARRGAHTGAKTTAGGTRQPAGVPEPAEEQQLDPAELRRRRIPAIVAAVILVLAVTAMFAPRLLAPAAEVPATLGVQPTGDPQEGPPQALPDPGPAAADPGTVEQAAVPEQSAEAPATRPQPTSPQAQTPPAENPPVRPAAPPAPTTGTVAVAIDLPAGGSVVARSAGGQAWAITRSPLALPAGTYTLEFAAPGYERDQRTLTVRAGEPHLWTPALRQVAQQQVTQPVRPPETPARDPAADRAAVEGLVGEFIAGMSRRDTGVLALLPANLRTNWETLFRNTSSFAASVGSIEPVQLNDDGATVRFTVNVSYRNPNGAGTATPTFTATARRTGESWRLVGVGN